MNPRFLLCGDTALVVEFGDRVDRELSDRVLRLAAAVDASRITGVEETVPTYRSLMVHYDPLRTDSASVVRAIEGLLGRPALERKTARRWRVPACYDERHAPDLAQVAERTGLAAEDVVRVHVDTRFHVYMIGFVPGFPYMGDLPQSLALPRREDPRVKVAAGAIAIAGRMSAIYPIESPGGWHLIGASPIRLFDIRASRPSLLAPGDEVRFERIGAREFDEIRAAVEAGQYAVPCETIEA